MCIFKRRAGINIADERTYSARITANRVVPCSVYTEKSFLELALHHSLEPIDVLVFCYKPCGIVGLSPPLGSK